MPNSYKSLIFTTHAWQRLKERSITPHAIWETVTYPEKTVDQKENTKKYFKFVQERNIHVVATFLPKEQKWLVISVWVRGEEDKIPLVWQLLTLPFKAGWWAVKRVSLLVFASKK